MTAYDGTIQVFINGVQYTGFVDWNVNLTRGQADLYGPPEPSSGSCRLLFMDTPSIPVNIGDKIAIKSVLAPPSPGATQIGYGFVSDLSLSTMAYGVSGSVWALDIGFVGLYSRLLQQKYYVASDTTSDTATALNNLFTAAQSSQWNELDNTSTWNDVDSTLTWATYDGASRWFTANVSGTGPSVTVQAANRDLWSDLNTLLVGGHCAYYEAPYSSDVFVYVNTTTPAWSAITWPSSYLNNQVSATVTVADIRNRVTVTDYTSTATGYAADDGSVYQYGAQEGSQATLLNNVLDAGNLATYIVKGTSEPTMQLSGFEVDLMNPNISDVDRAAMIGLYSVPFAPINITGLPAALGTAQMLVTRWSINITKYSAVARWETVPQARYYSSNTWNQVPNSYTWTSYGAAFPTQKWSDL